MRSLHRWLTTVFAVLLLFLAITGLLIQSDDLLALAGLGPHPGREIGAINGGADFMDPNFVSLGPGIAAPAKTQTPLTADPARLLATALAGLNTHDPLASVAWRAVQGIPQFVFTFTTNRPPLTINALTGAIIPVPPTAPQESGESFHDVVKAFHNGSVLAAPGVWAIFATGAALFLLSVTGVWLYAKMWLGRRSLARPGLFWAAASESLWRRIHRYVSLFAALFLAYVAVTGMLLSLDDIVVRFSAGYPPSLLRAGLPGGTAPAQAQPAPLPPADLPASFARLRAAIAAAAPQRPPLSITILAGQDAQVLAGGAHAALYLFNPATGAWTNPATAGIPAPSPYVGSLHWHQILKRLHRGDIIGLGGRWIIVASDLCLLFLATSGIVMYFQMLARRGRAGAKAWFW